MIDDKIQISGIDNFKFTKVTWITFWLAITIEEANERARGPLGRN